MMFGSNLLRVTYCPEIFRDFPQSIEVSAGILPPLGHDGFPPNPFQFVIHELFHSTLYRPDIDVVVKQPTKEKN
jgi:hypothetical protein